MQTQIVITIDHHIAASAKDRLGPVLDALVQQMYAMETYSIDYKEQA